ncbi:hypothetical protein GCM10010425_23090 [Streptomyces spororaveus]
MGTVSGLTAGGACKADPWGEDLQLALYMLYELHYRGFDGVDDARKWDPESRWEGGVYRP